MGKKVWKNQRFILSFVLIIALFLSSFFSYFSIQQLQGNARIINYAGVVRGATQRLIKKELQNQPDDKLIQMLDATLNQLQTGEGELQLHKLSEASFQANLVEMQKQWSVIKKEIHNFRNGGDATHLFALSEAYFDLSDKTVGVAETATEQQVLSALYYLIGMNVVFISFVIAFMIINARHRKRDEELEIAESENQRKSEYLSQMMDDFRAPIDDISELVYISDIENYDLLYLNEAGKRSYNTGDISGKKCYDVLQGRTSPCPFCTNCYLKGTQVYTWEFTNPVANRHYLLKDRLVEWHGKTARLEIAFDTTNSENEKLKLKNMLEAEKMIMSCVRVLYEDNEVKKGIDYVLQQLGSYMNAERTFIFEIHGDACYNTNEWYRTKANSQIDNLQAIPLTYIERWLTTFHRHECIIIEELEQIKVSSPKEYEILHKQNITSLVAAPLEYDGVITGFIGVDNPPVDKLENIASYLQTLRYFLMLANRRSESESKLSNLSYHDALTSFYNRNRYNQDIETYTNFHGTLGVVFMDLNGLKDINDRYGHKKGDEVLIKCAELIKEAFSEFDFYRIGGDEFVILCKHISEHMLYEYIKGLKNNLQKEPLCQAAIGYYWSDSLEDIDKAIAIADTRMYENKKKFYRGNRSSNRYRHHSDEILSLINIDNLKKNIEEHKFEVYLQPKVSSRENKVVGAEALVRYKSNNGKIVGPNDFLNLLEETQLIGFIDLHVFETVCQYIKKWHDLGKEDIPISVNFARCSLAEPDIVDKLAAICDKYHVDCSLLEIELTENNNSGTSIDLQSLATKLHSYGFKISIDDFGTEFANIATLTSIDFDILKLDKSLIDDIETNYKERMIIKIVADYCSNINLQVIAEGVEKQNQLDILNECDIYVIQGYLYSKPLPIEEYEELYVHATLNKE